MIYLFSKVSKSDSVSLNTTLYQLLLQKGLSQNLAAEGNDKFFFVSQFLQVRSSGAAEVSGFGSGFSLGLLRCQPTPQSPEACRVGTSVPVIWLTHVAIPLTLHCLITWISPWGCLSVFLTHGDHFPQFPKGEQGGSHSIFYDPVLEVIGYPFFNILLVAQASPTQHRRGLHSGKNMAGENHQGPQGRKLPQTPPQNS